MVVWPERGASDLHMVRLMPLPTRHLLRQQNPEWFILLVPAYPGCPGKKAVKRLCVCVYLFLGLGPKSGRYGGPPGIFGDRGAGHALRVAAVLIMSDNN